AALGEGRAGGAFGNRAGDRDRAGGDGGVQVGIQKDVRTDGVIALAAGEVGGVGTVVEDKGAAGAGRDGVGIRVVKRDVADGLGAVESDGARTGNLAAENRA